MAGELWNGTLQVGKETTAGTSVAATRRMYVREPILVPGFEMRPHAFATGTRDNRRAMTAGRKAPGGKFAMPLSADEAIEWYLMSIQGGVTPTTPSGGTLARQWSFSPGSSVPDAATIRWHDGARPWREAGVHVDKLTLAGAIDGENLMTAELLGRSFVQEALTGALSERTPSFIEGWQAALYIDAFEGTPGTTRKSGVLLGWQVEFMNNLARKYFADNTRDARGMAIGEMGASAQLTFEADSAHALTEFNNWEAGTKRLLRLVFGQNTQIESAPTNEVQSVIATSATSGTFTLSFEGVVSAAIAWNATAAAVQAALEALPNIGTGNLVAAGGPLPGTAVTLTFQGALSGLNVPALVADNASLVGGTAVITTPTPGVGYKKRVIIDLPGAWDVISLDQADGPTRAYRLSYEYVYDPTNAFGIRVQAINARTAAYA